MRFFLVVLALLLTACEASVSAPEAQLNPNTPEFLPSTAPAVIPPPNTPLPTNTRVPTNTPQAVQPSITPEPSISPTATLIELNISPLIEIGFEPPLHIRLPSGWTSRSDALMLPDLEGTVAVPFGFYNGPVTGGRGSIVVLYAFSSLIPSTTPNIPANLYGDALRMLLFTVIEPTCEYSFEEEATYRIAGRTARGALFAANQCPDGLPSLQGWFGALNVDGLNFAFYAYTEPYEAMNPVSRAELQAILDSVVFDFSLLPTPVPTAAP